jgi:hypothetical protein
VERAIRDLSRTCRDDLHSHLWAQAPEFQAEMQEIWDGFAADDHLAWATGACLRRRRPNPDP